MPVERVAVVDDDPVFLMMMRDVLDPLDLQVLTYNDSDSAFSSLIQVLPDLIILDLRMPTAANGWHLLDLLRLDPLTGAIPIIVCSAAREELLANAEALHERGIATLLKPFALDDLYRTIQAETGRYPLKRAEEDDIQASQGVLADLLSDFNSPTVEQAGQEHTHQDGTALYSRGL